MKRVHSVLTTLIVLQVAVVLLLGVMTIFSYQNREELNRLRQDLANRSPEESEATNGGHVERRLAAVESRLGLRDPQVDSIKKAFAAEQAEAASLEERLTAVRESAPLASATLPPAGSGEAPANMTMRPLANPNPILSDPSSQSQSIAQLETVATLTSYNAEWRFWKADLGRFDRIREKQEFAVRKRGTDQILARVKVSSIKESECAVDLVPGSLTDPDVLPEVGDELIDTTQLQ